MAVAYNFIEKIDDWTKLNGIVIEATGKSKAHEFINFELHDGAEATIHISKNGQLIYSVRPLTAADYKE